MKRALLAGCAAVAVLAAAGPAARAVDQEAVNRSIERGVAYLHNRDVLSQSYGATNQPTGVAALVGLTLLECGVAPDDEAVRRCLERVRPASVSETQTYSLALGILFLDRLGEPADEQLIQSMAVRLMAGQTASGGWTYTCPGNPDAEVRRLTNLLNHPAELVGRREPPKDDKNPDGKPAKKELPKEIQAQLTVIGASAARDGDTMLGDNSNTQFATLALWVARRHGVPTDKALGRVEQRFRSSQNPDGGWAYMPVFSPGAPTMTGSSGTMTCAGLLGLAVGLGPAAEKAEEKDKAGPDPGKDRGIKKALSALATVIGKPAGNDGKVPAVGGKSFYFFWSLERVAVILDLDTIGGKDWYAWASEILVANQAADGSWAGDYPGAADTCFALLCLRRANLARDLTGYLKGKVQDPGEVTLHAGGVGGEALKSALEPKDKAAPDESLSVAKPPKNPAESRPPASPAEETEGGRMVRELVQAPSERRDELLQKYRDGKGVAYTEALAGSVPQLSGDDKRKARDALAERLTRMKADTLARYFEDPDAEIRRAAALAAAMKQARSLIPDLIHLLSDAEPAVAHAAHAALKDLTGESLGPSAEEWKAWWKNRDK